MTEQQPPVPSDPTPESQPAPPAYQAFPPGGGPPVGYPAYPAPPAPSSSKTLAIIALVCAILGFLFFTWVAAVVLAIIVLSQSKAGKGLAIASLVVCGLWLVALVIGLAVSFADQADRDSTGKVTDAGSVEVTKIHVGDCIVDNVKGETNTSVDVVPCSKAHLYEAFANFTLPDGDYPGDDEVTSAAEDGCVKRFEGYVGIAYDDSKIDVTYLHPLEDSWDIDRGVTCLVTEGNGTGSLKDAKR